MTEAQKEYIITEDMLTIWMNRCINLSNPHTEGDICKKCEYRGKGGRKNCCDFDDNAIRRMFRSHSAKSDAVLDELLHWVEYNEDLFQYIGTRVLRGKVVAYQSLVDHLKELRTKEREQ